MTGRGTTTASTDALIARLALQARPLPSLAHPMRRGLSWGVAALAFGAAVVWAIGPRPDLAEQLVDMQFLLEQGAALATGLGAAVAALALTLPGSPQFLRLMPIALGAIWIGILGFGCMIDWWRMGWEGLRISPDPSRLLQIALIGALPVLALVGMLRRGVPVSPCWTIALAVLAAAGLGSFGIRFCYMQDAAPMVLVWQVGSVAVLAALSGLCGRRILPWPSCAR